MGKRKDEFVIIIDIDRVFSTDELAFVQEAGGAMETPEVQTAAAA
jgi:hypothetical protein